MAPDLSTSGKFPKQARVRRRREFVHIQKRGLRLHTRAFTIVAIANELDRPRLGIAVSRRVGNAVVRARLRRLIRELFRRMSLAWAPVDLVVIAKPTSARLGQAGFEAVRADLATPLDAAARRAHRKAQ